MSKSKQNVTINFNQVKPHPALQPKKDDTFMELFMGALEESTPTYFGFIPLRLIHPFDQNFLPNTFMLMVSSC